MLIKVAFSFVIGNSAGSPYYKKALAAKHVQLARRENMLKAQLFIRSGHIYRRYRGESK